MIAEHWFLIMFTSMLIVLQVMRLSGEKPDDLCAEDWMWLTILSFLWPIGIAIFCTIGLIILINKFEIELPSISITKELSWRKNAKSDKITSAAYRPTGHISKTGNNAKIPPKI